MNDQTPPLYSLVLYKKRPARVVQSGERLEIELDDGNRARVRPKDVALLHPGPLRGLSDLRPCEGELELAWQIWCETPGQAHGLNELVELAFGEYTPAAAWATWQWVENGLYFRGSPEAILPRTPQEVEREQAARQARLAEAQAWSGFVERVRAGTISPEQDGRHLREVEDLAYGRREDSRLLRELGRAERPEGAHALLLNLKYWGQTVNPYPARLRLPTASPAATLPPLPDEPRLDLTHLPAFAIDDRDNQDPDDALSLETCQTDADGRFQSGRVWVHVADAAALVPPDSPADLEGRARAATLYLPEGPVLMLPRPAIETLGLGLQDISPTLSFGITINAAGEISQVDIQPSWVRVQRLSYEQAEQWLDDPQPHTQPLHDLHLATQAYLARRQANGALLIDLPEVMMHVVDEQVSIRPVLRLRSRDLVREAMLMAGEAAAGFAVEQRLPFPFASQPGPATPTPSHSTMPPASLAERFAVRRTLQRSQVTSHPAPHAGVGLSLYSRATSPLRRYLDLAAHQQLRALLRGQRPLSEQQMLERLGASEAVVGSVNQAEFLSRRHWTLVYLAQHLDWRGEAVLVDKQGLRGYVIIPELALETAVHLPHDLPLDSHLTLSVNGMNLAELEIHFTVEALR